MNAAQVDLQQLRIKHILYKSKVRSSLYGGSYDDAYFSRFGPVNTWFDTIGLVKYKQVPEVQELSQLQNQLNTTVANLNALYKSGKIEEAISGLSAIETKSERFLGLITQLEKVLGDN